MKQSELQQQLDNAPVLSGVPDSKAAEALLDLFAHPGFITLWGLLLGARQGQLLMLAQLPLGNAQQVTHAAVIQGKIKGIECLRDTALEHAVPDGVSVEKEQI